MQPSFHPHSSAASAECWSEAPSGIGHRSVTDGYKVFSTTYSVGSCSNALTNDESISPLHHGVIVGDALMDAEGFIKTYLTGEECRGSCEILSAPSAVGTPDHRRRPQRSQTLTDDSHPLSTQGSEPSLTHFGFRLRHRFSAPEGTQNSLTPLTPDEAPEANMLQLEHTAAALRSGWKHPLEEYDTAAGRDLWTVHPAACFSDADIVSPRRENAAGGKQEERREVNLEPTLFEEVHKPTCTSGTEKKMIMASDVTDLCRWIQRLEPSLTGRCPTSPFRDPEPFGKECSRSFLKMACNTALPDEEAETAAFGDEDDDELIDLWPSDSLQKQSSRSDSSTFNGPMDVQGMLKAMTAKELKTETKIMKDGQDRVNVVNWIQRLEPSLTGRCPTSPFRDPEPFGKECSRSFLKMACNTALPDEEAETAAFGDEDDDELIDLWPSDSLQKQSSRSDSSTFNGPMDVQGMLKAMTAKELKTETY